MELTYSRAFYTVGVSVRKKRRQWGQSKCEGCKAGRLHNKLPCSRKISGSHVARECMRWLSSTNEIHGDWRFRTRAEMGIAVALDVNSQAKGTKEV